MKACEIETAISRTESKGLKEKLMLDTSIIQAVKKSCFISTEVGEQSRAEVLPQPVAKVPLPNLPPKNANQKIQINECIWWPAPHLHISSVQTENSLCRNPLTLRAINSFQDCDSSHSYNNTQGLNNTVVFPSCQGSPSSLRLRDSMSFCPSHTKSAIAKPLFCKSYEHPGALPAPGRRR